MPGAWACKVMQPNRIANNGRERRNLKTAYDKQPHYSCFRVHLFRTMRLRLLFVVAMSLIFASKPAVVETISNPQTSQVD